MPDSAIWLPLGIAGYIAGPSRAIAGAEYPVSIRCQDKIRAPRPILYLAILSGRRRGGAAEYLTVRI
jgi:hypothetical protein